MRVVGRALFMAMVAKELFCSLPNALRSQSKAERLMQPFGWECIRSATHNLDSAARTLQSQCRHLGPILSSHACGLGNDAVASQCRPTSVEMQCNHDLHVTNPCTELAASSSDAASNNNAAPSSHAASEEQDHADGFSSYLVMVVAKSSKPRAPSRT